jgi:hypothetical protein
MGGCLSGTLANIYLHHFEAQIIPKYSTAEAPVFYSRYIDDSILLTPKDVPHKQILTDITTSSGLTLTHTTSNTTQNYLDITITKNPDGTFSTHTFFKFASPIHRSYFKNTHKEANIIISQFLRLWRTTSKNMTLTALIKHAISYLIHQGTPNSIIQKIEHFLYPIQLTNNTYSANHLICTPCLNRCKPNNTHVIKLFLFHHIIISSRILCTCQTKVTHILMRNSTDLKWNYSTYDTIHNTIKIFSKTHDLILPIGNINDMDAEIIKNKLQNLFLNIEPTEPPQQRAQPFPHYIYPVVQNSNSIYGCRTAPRREHLLINKCNT